MSVGRGSERKGRREREAHHLVLCEVAHAHDAPRLRGQAARADAGTGQTADVLALQTTGLGVAQPLRQAQQGIVVLQLRASVRRRHECVQRRRRRVIVCDHVVRERTTTARAATVQEVVVVVLAEIFLRELRCLLPTQATGRSSQCADWRRVVHESSERASGWRRQ